MLYYKLILILLVTIVNAHQYAMDNTIYKHPLLAFQFTASENWSQINHPEDNLIYEVTNPGNALHVMLWYRETEQSAKKYLIKMADMKGLADKHIEPNKVTIDNKDSWQHETISTIGNENVKSFISVTANGHNKQRAKENCLYILHIWCMEEDYVKYDNRIDEIIASVKINSVP
jgi:hypothetical protein